MNQWKFFRSGGFDQVLLETDADLRHLDELDQKLWAVLACPTHGLELNADLMSLLDADKDGRIRVPEVLTLVSKLNLLLADSSLIFKRAETLSASAFNQKTPEGQSAYQSSLEILAALGYQETDPVGEADYMKAIETLKSGPVTGDGQLRSGHPALTGLQPALSLLESVHQLPDGLVPFSLITGIQQRAEEELAFRKTAGKDAATRLFGSDFDQAYRTFLAVESKIDDYFNRVDLLVYQENWTDALNARAPETDGMVLSTWTGSIEQLPLSQIKNERKLHLQDGINPAWKSRIQDFSLQVAGQVTGKKEKLTDEDWLKIKAVFHSYQTWLADKPQTGLESVPADAIEKALHAVKSTNLGDLSDQNDVVAARLARWTVVKEVMICVAHLDEFLNNYVSLRYFYTKTKPASFQSGKLFLDGRSSELVIRVADPGAHAAMSNLAYIFLVYCECSRKDSPDKFMIAAALTDGDVDNLMVGRNGVYYDRSGKDWDARIVKILDHPISIRQAFWSPYNRFARMVSGWLEKFASSKDKAMESQAAANIDSTGSKLTTAPAPEQPKAPPQPFDVGKFAGIFAAIGLAFAALSTAIVSVATGFLSLSWYQMPLAVAGIMLLISGPSMLLAWLKLRNRNLAPLLDANGWAVNTRAKINIPFGRSLTRLSKLPPGSVRLLKDPYQQKNYAGPIITVIILLAGLAILAWYMEWIKL